MDAHDTTGVVDVVLDAPASVSIYLQALTQAGRRVESAAVVHAHKTAARDASGLLAVTAGRSTIREVGAPGPHRYDPASRTIDLVVHGMPDHLALHSHLLVEGDADVFELRPRFPDARSRYARRLRDTPASELGLQLVGDSGVLELKGAPTDLAGSFESLPAAGAPGFRSEVSHGARARAGHDCADAIACSRTRGTMMSDVIAGARDNSAQRFPDSSNDLVAVINFLAQCFIASTSRSKSEPLPSSNAMPIDFCTDLSQLSSKPRI